MLPRNFVATAGLLVQMERSTPRTESVVTDPIVDCPRWGQASRSRSRSGCPPSPPRRTIVKNQ